MNEPALLLLWHLRVVFSVVKEGCPTRNGLQQLIGFYVKFTLPECASFSWPGPISLLIFTHPHRRTQINAWRRINTSLNKNTQHNAVDPAGPRNWPQSMVGGPHTHPHVHMVIHIHTHAGTHACTHTSTHTHMSRLYANPSPCICCVYVTLNTHMLSCSHAFRPPGV